jgi:hypothetical protein
MTIIRSGAVLPVQVRTARKRHVCNDCPVPIEPGERYELSATPPHRLDVWDSGRWLTWRAHYPRHDGGRFLRGCAVAAAYAEKAEREKAEAQLCPVSVREPYGRT